MQHAVEEEVVALEHVQVVDAVVVLAGEEVGEPAAEVVVGLGVRAKLVLEGGVDDLRIAQVAVEEGAEGDAVGV